MSAYFGLSLFLLADTSSPALEKSLSDGTEVAGTHRYFLASMLIASHIGDDATSTSLKSMLCVLHSSL